MEKKTENNSSRNIYLIIILIVTISVVIFMYISSREMKINNCIEEAKKAYSDSWDSNCKAFGEDADCTLPGYLADSLLETRDNTEDRCIKIYK